MQVKKEKTLDGNTYYIRAFPAFAASNLSGEIASLIMPALGAIVPMVGGKAEGSLFDMDAEKAAPILANALTSISGDKVENLLKKLLVREKNISVQIEGENEAVLLTEDLANELFCGDVQDMFILAWEVIQANFPRIFSSLQNLFGDRAKDLPEILQTSQNTESST